MQVDFSVHWISLLVLSCVFWFVIFTHIFVLFAIFPIPMPLPWWVIYLLKLVSDNCSHLNLCQYTL